MDNTGWIKLHRQLLDSPLYKDCNAIQRDILISILLTVNHKPNKWIFKGQEFIVQEGQMITSLESLAKICAKGTTVQNVRTALNKFEKYNFITNKSTNKNRLISIVNWSLYQGSIDDINKQTNKQLTSNFKEPKVEEIKEVVNKNEYTEFFEKLWALYPNKTNKKGTFKKVKKLLKTYEESQLLTCVINYNDKVKREKKDKQFIKAAYNFFDDYFLDFLEKKVEKPKVERKSLFPTVFKDSKGNVIEE